MVLLLLYQNTLNSIKTGTMKLSSISIFFSCLISINHFILLHKIFPKVRTYIRNWKTSDSPVSYILVHKLKSLQFLVSEFTVLREFTVLSA